MDVKILGTAKDLRTQTPVIYAQCDIPSYLSLVGEEFASFSIQRKREKFTAYTRLKADIVNGTLLPTITLALPIESSALALEVVDSGNLTDIKSIVQDSTPLNILDGLQRTFILREIFESGHVFPPDQLVHLEIRAEPDLDHLIYRIIVLNAGQKPMSMRHQIEILSLSLRKTLINEIERLELVPEVDGGRRTRARRYSLDKVSSGYHAYLLKSPEVDKQNVVAQRLSEQAVLQQDVEQFGVQFIEFVEFFRLYCELDDAVESTQVPNGSPTATNWLGNENTLNAFFAAVADFGSTPSRKERIKTALRDLTVSIRESGSEETMGLDLFQAIIAGFPSRKTNIGYATRKLIFVTLKEFFRDEGETPLRDIWEREAE
ncbi:hypothetical protein PS683_01249 [Pseudomonas fluorescens]|uniref:Uncharacterized protein n=1 Tax=Pseudomonas fluorescens TaxID=294 RepID=A0A5E6MS37_PSEFL|nr:hypothetical protein PS683_01249 [Pseudomonas fluorescens]VVM60149.1 hypothetical protein PS683_01249 [Pseudomonas fluorescens]